VVLFDKSKIDGRCKIIKIPAGVCGYALQTNQAKGAWVAYYFV
jgi:hypothetical protein